MRKYDFDTVINRRGTGAMKFDGMADAFGGDSLQPLWIADMDFAVAPAITEALQKRMAHPIYGYNVVNDSFWQAIIDWQKRRHNWTVDRNEIIFIPGVVKGIGYAINFFTKPGDKVIIQPPIYPPFRAVTEGNGREVVGNPLIEMPDGSYRMNLEELEQIMASQSPRMMILCNPHNPIGIQWSVTTLQKVAGLAARYGVVVVSDEIHGDLVLNGKPHIPFASVSEEAASVAVTLGAPSKTFNIAGMVSSWCVVCNPKLRDPFFHWMAVNEFSAPTFTAMISTEAAYRNGEEWLDALLDYIEGNIDEVRRLLAEHLPAVKIVCPGASFLIWLDCRGLNLSQELLVKLFCDKAHLALNNGATFGSEGIGFMRLNIGCPRSELRRAILSLAECVNRQE